ncbi:enoyl-CoA hydratase/isomerase family protein [Usitatibacter palustris]|uniref:Short-chain-enoyl-CoA hydratase n=1 Tax=Usitatibacter palustris TaxID=2732487 RepID=A0A6M4H9B7_9PROT|nr:enoyl-CoA hydratase-related protein [Usitatibacter palustris]QJR15323.1 Short-chain-enoyl-CoA hydratase [Usitatibacter palustris]
MENPVLVQREGAIAVVVLNRPEKLNAINRAMWHDLAESFEALADETWVRCIVLRGAGTKAFAPGADITEFTTERSTIAKAKVYADVMRRAIEAIDQCPHPVVAMIHGVCVGGGLEVAGLADLRICGESSRFGVPIAKLGLTMAYPEIEGLVRLVGEATALEILLEGRVFDAKEALAKGLVTRVVADGEVEAEAMATAQRIADGAPLVARWHKKFAHRLRSPAPLTDDEYDEGIACFGTDDFQEGHKAFLEKRKPSFKGE